MAETYEVGYGKPPKHTRFQKGHSGNRKGRPRGSANVQSEMKRLLATKTRIKIDGAVRTVGTAKALCFALIQKAMSGNVHAFSKIVEIVGPEMADELRATTTSASATDLDIVRRALDRKAQQAASPAAPIVNPPGEKDES